MEIYIFEAQNMNGIYGYSPSKDESSLPKQVEGKNISSWVFTKKITVEDNDTRPYIGLNIVECLNSINKYGCYVNRININSTIN